MAKLTEGVGGLSSLDAICAKLSMSAGGQCSPSSTSLLHQTEPSSNNEDNIITSNEMTSINDNNNDSLTTKVAPTGGDVTQHESRLESPSTEIEEENSVSKCRNSEVEEPCEVDMTVKTLQSIDDVIAGELIDETNTQTSPSLIGLLEVTNVGSPYIDRTNKDTKLEMSSDAVSMTPLKGNEPLPVTKDGTGSRKSRRKNFQPRCIQGTVECRAESPTSWNTMTTASVMTSPEVERCADVSSNGKSASDIENSYSVLDLRVTGGNSGSGRDSETTSSVFKDVGVALIDIADNEDALDLSRGPSLPRRDNTSSRLSMFDADSERDSRPTWVCSRPPLTTAVTLNDMATDHRGRKLMTGGGQVKVDLGTKSPPASSMAMDDLMAVYGLRGDVASGAGAAPRSTSSSFQRFPSPSFSSWNDQRLNDRYGRSHDQSRDQGTAFGRRLDDTVNQLRSDFDAEDAEDDASKASTDSLSDSMSSATSNVTATSLRGQGQPGRGQGLPALLAGKKRAYEGDVDSDGTSPSIKNPRTLGDVRTSGATKRQQSVPDYTQFVSQNIQRFESYLDCGAAQCRDKDYKEHFHCTACSVQVSLKKDKIVRHFKWHKKRDDSLQQGFLRFSPLEDCSKKCAPNCSHNGRNTHYHCIKDGCNKVYISTSDVQMHANFHRKDTAIIQEGFQRYRATENCKSTSCMFAEQKTTHFHCRRPGCSFTFKNKSDMEKHKMYHQKDEMLARDGFKKFMKYEPCNFSACPYSHLSNHIHCIRPGCNYVLHSSGQLFSHKRKHERRTLERGAFKQFRSILPSSTAAESPSATVTSSSPYLSHGVAASLFNSSSTFLQQSMATDRPFSSATQSFTADIKPGVDHSLTAGVKSEARADFPFSVEPKKKRSAAESYAAPQPMDLCVSREERGNESSASKEFIDISDLAPLARLKAGVDLSSSQVEVRPSESSPTLTQLMSKLGDARSPANVSTSIGAKSSSAAAAIPAVLPTAIKASFAIPKPIVKTGDRRERDDSWKTYLTRMHEQQDRVTSMTFTVSADSSPCPLKCEHSQQLHYHCNWAGCDCVILSTDSVFARLEHHKSHEYSTRRSSMTVEGLRNLGKRRGRPPKYDANDDEELVVPTVPRTELSDEEIRARAAVDGPSSPMAFGFVKYDGQEPCPDARCAYRGNDHYHCARQRCHFVETGDNETLASHVRDFHAHVQIKDGFEFFDASVDCRRPKCHARRGGPGPSGVRHFHCIQPRCDYAFVRFSTMTQHARKHHGQESQQESKTSTGSAIPVGHRGGAAVTLGDTLSSQVAAGLLLSKLMPGLISESSLPPTVATINSFLQRTMLARAMSGSLFPTSSPLMMLQPSGGLQAPVLSSSSSTVSLPSVNSSSISTPTFVQSLMKSAQLNLAGLQTVFGLGSSSLSNPPPVTAFDGRPLSTLLQTPMLSTSVTSGASAAGTSQLDDIKSGEYYSADENCGRPFCKLKKRDHHHCPRCGLAFSDISRLRVHVARQCSGAGTVATGNAGSSTDLVRSSAHRQQQDVVSSSPSKISLTGTVDTNAREQDGGGHESDSSTGSAADKFDDEEEMMDGDENEESDEDNSGDTSDVGGEPDDNDDGQVVMDLSASKPHQDKTSDVSAVVDNNNTSTAVNRKSSFIAHEQAKETDALGYDRFRCSEDCRVERCSYRGTMTHYHCRRADCGYSFCDRARFASHVERHRRIDAIAGDQFVQCHAKAPCNWDPTGRCPLAARGSTHYHCRMCPSFVCTDATKIAAHRKRHDRLDRVAVDGFQRFAVGANCGDPTCVSRFGRVTHGHCTQPGCGQVVVGTAQMALHRALHDGSTNGSVGGSSTVGAGGAGTGGQTSTLFQPLASLASLVQLPILQASATVSAAV